MHHLDVSSPWESLSFLKVLNETVHETWSFLKLLQIKEAANKYTYTCARLRMLWMLIDGVYMGLLRHGFF